MNETLAVETPETTQTQPEETPREAVLVPITPEEQAVYGDSNFGDAVQAAARIRQLAPEYHHHYKLSKRAASDAETIKDELSYQFAIYKAIHVGKGRDGNWGPFITELGFAVRTIDRWVDQKLASGELPEWVATRLAGNKRTDPEAKPAPEPEGEKLYTLLLHFDESQKKEFAEAANKFDEGTLAEVIFEAVTTHPVALAPKKRSAFLDDDTEVATEEAATFLEQWEQHNAAEPTLLGQLEQHSAMEATA